jgi:hypothetical protein
MTAKWLEESKDENGQPVGEYSYMEELETYVTFILVCDKTDPGQKIRDKLGHGKLAWSWSASTRVQPSGDNGAKYRQFEVRNLNKWLEMQTEGNFRVAIRPVEDILQTEDEESVTWQLRDWFQPRSVPDSSNLVLFVGPVNQQLLTYKEYVQKCVMNFIKQRLTAEKEIYCVLDVSPNLGLSQIQDIIPVIPSHLEVNLWSGLDPAHLTVSCVVVHVSMAV